MLFAHVSWPSAPLTNSLVHTALDSLDIPISFVDNNQLKDSEPLLQWSTYDDLDHELTHFRRDTVLASSYTFRKALIRKHYLSHVIQMYVKKQPHSVLKSACPRTFEIELSFADELDEMWTDELWELGNELESGASWWILKPGMADRGMGIRLFNSKCQLQQIFETFEESDSDKEGDEANEENGTAVMTSQLRHFVIQEYISNPLLLDPSETLNKDPISGLIGRKFHLRAYCISSGDIQLYLYNRALALFSSVPYRPLPSESISSDIEIDLRAHLTNTSLQTDDGESNVRLLTELEGCRILSGSTGDASNLSLSDIDGLIAQMSQVLCDTFKAALENPVHFQALPNAFELFGVDFLVTHVTDSVANPFQVKILEVNAEPAIELTGPRLTWILEDLFTSIAKVCIEPFFGDQKVAPKPWAVGEARHNLLKCLDENVRGPGMQ